MNTTPPAAPAWELPLVTHVPLARWGKDHWTVLAYVEARAVDHRGMLSHDQMRCDRGRHQMFFTAKRLPATMSAAADGARYPTRLKTPRPDAGGRWGSVELPGHDDYDCLADTVREGLVAPVMPQPRQPHGDVFLNARGQVVTDVDGGLIDPSFVTGMTGLWLMTQASYTLTDLGREIAGELRAFLAVTPRSHQFMPSRLTAAPGGR
jgi:hypothetical protein